MDTRTASLLRRVQEALPRSAGNLASEISDFLSAALPQDLPDSHFSAAIQREGRWEVFAELRTQVDSLPLHPHKRKVVRDWLDEAARAAPPPAQGPADHITELAAALGWPGGISDPVMDWPMLLREVARLRIARLRAAQALAAAPAESEGERVTKEQALDALEWVFEEYEIPSHWGAVTLLRTFIKQSSSSASVAPGGEREAFEASRKALGWADRADEKGIPLLARHVAGETWWGSESTMPTYRSAWTEAQWNGWQARAAKPSVGTQAAHDVLAERQRQISAEGWTPEHDDTHSGAALACAASCYACAAAGLLDAERDWPWDGGFKRASPRRMLVKAGALILAEIERLDRAAHQHTGQGGGE